MDPQTLSAYAAQLRYLSNGGAGAGGTATCALTATGNVRSFSINAAGSGYSVNDVLTCNDATFTVTEVNGTGGVVAATKTTGGTAIIDATGLATTVAPAGGTGCKLNLVAQFQIDTVTVTNAGTGYISALALITGGNGSGGAVTFAVTNGAISGNTVVTGGNYRTAPTIQVVAGPPADRAALIAAMTTFDETLLNARLLEALGGAGAVAVINANANASIAAALAALRRR